MPITCPHCSAETDTPGAFCAECGKAMPSAATAGPRVLGDTDLATSAAGQSLQFDQLARESRTGFRCLLAVGILQFIGGGLLIALAASGVTAGKPEELPVAAGAFVASIGFVFLGLAAWARKSPLPASITGLVLIGSLWTLDAIFDPASIYKGLIIKIIVVGCLIRAIKAAVKARALSRQASPLGDAAEPQPLRKAA